MRATASRSLGLERCRVGATLVVAALVFSLTGELVFGLPAAAAQSLATARQMRAAGEIAEEFFESLRDSDFDDAYEGLDRSLTTKYGRSTAMLALRNHRMILAGTSIDEKYTFAADGNPREAISCVEAKSKRPRKLYLTARLIQRGQGPHDWKVQGFKITSVPERGCPT